MTIQLKRSLAAGPALGLLGLLAIGCGALKPGSTSSGDGGGAGDGVITESDTIASVTERDDGSYDVVCKDGREVVAAKDAVEAACNPVVATDTSTDTDDDDEADDDDEIDATQTVGIKNGDQIVAHYSLMTGVKYEELDDNAKAEVIRLKAALGGDNSPEKFTPSAVLAAAKLATLYCSKFLEREAVAQSNPDSGIEPKLPQLDFNSAFLGKEIARPIYDYFTGIFWGVDTATQPKQADTYAALDGMMDAFAEPVMVNDAEVGPPNLRASVLGICAATAASFPALEL